MSESDRTFYVTLGFAVAALFAVLWMGLLPALLGGLLVYFLLEFGSRILGRVGVIPATGKLILLIAIALIVITALAGMIIAALSFVSEGPESLSALVQRIADIVAAARTYIPGWAQNYVPSTMQDWQHEVSDWLRGNVAEFSLLGKEVGLVLLHLIFGMVIGGMIAITPAGSEAGRTLADALTRRAENLSLAFRRIVFSQIRISALNTLLTGVFLVIILPLTGHVLPLAKTMIVVTFFVGLLPIVGNLISNTVIFLIALSVSPFAAIGSLVFLIAIHKLEYFINAHIIGTQIRSKAWELLLAMLVLETLFGLSGLVAAPIFYAYIKDELAARKLV